MPRAGYAYQAHDLIISTSGPIKRRDSSTTNDDITKLTLPRPHSKTRTTDIIIVFPNTHAYYPPLTPWIHGAWCTIKTVTGNRPFLAFFDGRERRRLYRYCRNAKTEFIRSSVSVIFELHGQSAGYVQYGIGVRGSSRYPPRSTDRRPPANSDSAPCNPPFRPRQ
ncbi:hypothetical protein BD410DRAFT_781718 [Rickenella mellea]|uniref:Uncharacterized protein n=1 Tax=Rickenella mellea TaxID=50990 RepID=A0A4Y7QK71_9AGAM|nr:hypothetical protein BD410DRAFT_781718 [Rickenella mellea]